MTTESTASVDERLTRLIGGINSLPTPPIVFTQIQKVLNNPHTSAYDIGGILQEDPAISAKVLKMTNSAYYGLSRTIESVKQAVVIIGLEAIKNLVLSASVLEAFKSDTVSADFQENFWRHSLATAITARTFGHILRDKQTFDVEAAFSAGMLHNIGKMIMVLHIPEDFKKAEEAKAQFPTIPDYMVEEKTLGYDHAMLGSLLAQHWQLPQKLAESIRYHHYPMSAAIEENNLPLLIYASNWMATYSFEYDPDEDVEPDMEPLQESVLERLGVSTHKLKSLVGRLREEYSKAETFMEMAKG